MDKKLTKSNNKMLAGVCAGIAEYLVGCNHGTCTISFFISVFCGIPRFVDLHHFGNCNA